MGPARCQSYPGTASTESRSGLVRALLQKQNDIATPRRLPRPQQHQSLVPCGLRSLEDGNVTDQTEVSIRPKSAVHLPQEAEDRFLKELAA